MKDLPPLDFEQPILDLQKKLQELQKHAAGNDMNLEAEIRTIEQKVESTREEVYRNLTAWQHVQIARHPNRPFASDYIEHCFTDFVELHGDRLYGDDPALVAGLATLGEIRCAVIGNQKGRDVRENVYRNFGSAHPEGFRKALRVMKLAEKFKLPVITLIDIPGAYPGVGAEERHIAESIAVNLREMMVLRTPIIAMVIGEGGSGGALGIGVADRIYILENAYYSVISPEGCAAILWKHRKHAPEAAEALKLTAQDLKGFGIVDDVVPEPLGGAHHDPDTMYRAVTQVLASVLQEVSKLSGDRLLNQRYDKFRKMGIFGEEP